MRKARIAVLVITLLLMAVPGMVSAQAAGRLSARVIDHEGNPIPGVEVTVTTPDLEEYEERATTNKKGKFLMSHTDTTLSYTYRLEKEGFQAVVERVRVNTGAVTQVTFRMLPEGSRSPDQPLPPEGQAALAYNAGVEAQLAGDLETAVQRFRRSIELDPTAAIPHTGLAGVYFIQEKWMEAAAEAEKALELDPADQRALQIRYEAYMGAGETALAAEAAEALSTTDASSEVAGRAYNDAVDAYQQGDRATARRMLEEAVMVNPGLVRPHVFLAAICREEGDLDRAEQEVMATLEIEPNNALALRLGYEIAALQGDLETEVAMAGRLADADPEYAGDHFLPRAVELYDANQFAGAAAIAAQVVKVRPEDAKAHFILGMASFNTGDSETAREHLERFIELAPDDPDAAIARELLSYSN
jgi:tetratricopeptide (TPR) repeat protein